VLAPLPRLVSMKARFWIETIGAIACALALIIATLGIVEGRRLRGKDQVRRGHRPTYNCKRMKA